MAKTKVEPPADVVERNILLTGKMMKFLLDHPQVFGFLPDKFELVLLPDDDPEIRLYNLELLDKYGSEGKPVVFARIKAHPENVTRPDEPSIFVPIPIAA
jgi:hypothetical protein